MKAWIINGALLGAVGIFCCSGEATAQSLVETNAAMGVSDTLNSTAVGPSTSAVQRARDTVNNAAPLPPPPPTAGSGATLPPPPPIIDPVAANAAAQTATVGAQRAVDAVANIQVIAGTRVFDPVSGELVDDASEQQVPASQKNLFFDDGTHGDIEPNDGKYTNVDERHDALGQSSQRVKERLVQALLSAEGLNPLQFYGYRFMSTERTEEVSRGRAWSVVKDPKGGPGFVLAEVPISQPQAVPKYRKALTDRDQKIKEDWAKRFLQEYRTDKNNLMSDFHGLYIPQPPPVPFIAAPDPQAWQPFSDPGAGQQDLNAGAPGFGPNAGLGPAGGGDMAQFKSGYR